MSSSQHMHFQFCMHAISKTMKATWEIKVKIILSGFRLLGFRDHMGK